MDGMSITVLTFAAVVVIVMQTLVFVEPEAVFAQRRAPAQQVEFPLTRVDYHIRNLLRAGPVPIMSVLNSVGRLLPANGKRARRAIQREILLRLGAMIRRAELRRIKRKFVGLPAV